DGDWQQHTVRIATKPLGSTSRDPARFERDLFLFLRNRLRLIDDAWLKAAVLASARVTQPFGTHRQSVALATSTSTAPFARFYEGATPYVDWLVNRLIAIVADPHSVSPRDIAALGIALRTIGLGNPSLHEKFLADTTPQAMSRLIQARGTISE